MKILVTGRNQKVASDLSEHLTADKGYEVIQCEPEAAELFNVLLDEAPEVVILCLGEERADTFKPFDVIKNGTINGKCRIIVIANEEDEKLFLRNTNFERLYLLSRPVSLDALYKKLARMEVDIAKEKESGISIVREYTSANAGKGFRRKNILVVDDDTDQLLHIKEQLQEFYDVTLVRSGADAFKFLKKKIPDLILLDYLMPEKDGSDVLKEMRTIEEYAEIPVIFLTGISDRNAIIDILAELMPQGYIIKPSKKSEIVAKIIDVLG